MCKIHYLLFDPRGQSIVFCSLYYCLHTFNRSALNRPDGSGAGGVLKRVVGFQEPCVGFAIVAWFIWWRQCSRICYQIG